MHLAISQTSLSEVQDLRELFLQENNIQFVYDKCHLYGWADTYLFRMNEERIGYGAVWGTDRRVDRDTIFEFFILRPFRKHANQVFSEFCDLSKAAMIEAQTNDKLLSPMLYGHAQNIRAEAILFEDAVTTRHHIPGVIFRKRRKEDKMGEDDSDYVLEQNDTIVASGGLMLNYNKPYADVYMQVKETARRQGLGSLIVQELKKQAYLMGRVPAARCNVNNHISQSTLVNAGFAVCGFIVKGDINSKLKM